MFEIKGKYTTAKIMIDQVEEEAISQIYHFMNHVAFTNPVAIMPDTHSGKGSVIGFTMGMTDKLIPNVVGVDIGCGLRSLNVGPSIPLSLKELDHKIRQKVPFGVAVHDQPAINIKKDFWWKQANIMAEKFCAAYAKKFGTKIDPPHYDVNWFEEKCKVIGGGLGRIINSLGTLGGGNHFCEVGQSQSTGDYWVTVHTGSRNFGKRICEYWQSRAVKYLRKDKASQLRTRIDEIKQEYKYTPRKIKEEIAKVKHELQLDSGIDMKGCEWLENEGAHGYLFDMLFAQIYATVNRVHILRIIVDDILKLTKLDEIESVHNFIDFEDFIIRKGAIRSYKGERMVIPFNMRDGIPYL